MLDRDEHVEQAYFFRQIGELLGDGLPLQEIFEQAREETLATTRLPLAIDFLSAELKHHGVFATAMEKLPHYFTAFQTFVVNEAELERGRFDMRTAFEVLRAEADYRTKEPSRQGSFLFQLEVLCRNRFRYDPGLWAASQDPMYPKQWQSWILTVRRQVGIVDLADLIYVRSEFYAQKRARIGKPLEDEVMLFGEKEGKIAFANRQKDPVYLFKALHRHLGYPSVPRLRAQDRNLQMVPLLARRMERMEQRVKLLEEEQRGGIDLSKFMPDHLKRPPDSSL